MLWLVTIGLTIAIVIWVARGSADSSEGSEKLLMLDDEFGDAATIYRISRAIGRGKKRDAIQKSVDSAKRYLDEIEMADQAPEDKLSSICKLHEAAEKARLRVYTSGAAGFGDPRWATAMLVEIVFRTSRRSYENSISVRENKQIAEALENFSNPT